MKLHLGCGRNKKEGYLNCDISAEVNPDKIVNLEKRLPFKDHSVQEIIIEHCLEHIKNLFQIIEEMYRILKPKGIIKIKVPYFSSESAFSTMTHINFFTYTTFDFLDSKNKVHYDFPNVDFKIKYKKLHWRGPMKIFSFFNLIPKLYQTTLCWIFPAHELEIILECKK